MTKRDFEAVAKVLREAEEKLLRDGRLDEFAGDMKLEVAKGLADYFASRNPRFDRLRFLAAAEAVE